VAQEAKAAALENAKMVTVEDFVVKLRMDKVVLVEVVVDKANEQARTGRQSKISWTVPRPT
jgi:hypothetical protein